MIFGIMLLVFAYLFGSVPTGLILSKCYKKVDIRDKGSGNIGATNVYRTLGKKLGALTLFGDVFKGMLPVAAAIWFLKSPAWISLAAFAAFIGHIYPIFLLFKGGKGVATALGVFIIIVPWSLLISTFVFIITVYIWRYVSLGSIMASITLPVWILLFSYSKNYFILSIIISGLIVYKHKKNIQLLIKGEESKVGGKTR